MKTFQANKIEENLLQSGICQKTKHNQNQTKPNQNTIYIK